MNKSLVLAALVATVALATCGGKEVSTTGNASASSERSKPEVSYTPWKKMSETSWTRAGGHNVYLVFIQEDTIYFTAIVDFTKPPSTTWSWKGSARDFDPGKIWDTESDEPGKRDLMCPITRPLGDFREAFGELPFRT